MQLRLETNLRLWAAIIAVGIFAVAVIFTRQLWWPERAIAEYFAGSSARLKQIEASMPARSLADSNYSSNLFSPEPMGGHSLAEPTQAASPNSGVSYTGTMYSMPNYLPQNVNPAGSPILARPVLALPDFKDLTTTVSPPAFQSLPAATTPDFKLPLQLMLPSPTGGLVSTGDILPVTPTIGGVQGVPAAPLTGPLSGARR